MRQMKWNDEEDTTPPMSTKVARYIVWLVGTGMYSDNTVGM